MGRVGINARRADDAWTYRHHESLTPAEVREFKPSEKKTHWGKRKLARDR
jgi:hypothetical protein